MDMPVRSISRDEIRRLAEECLINMGDIFWDRNHYCDPEEDGFTDPTEAAGSSIIDTLERFARRCGIPIEPV